MSNAPLYRRMPVRHTPHRLAIAMLLVGLLLLMCASCAASQPALTAEQQSVHLPGFWRGFWNGFIAPITFFVSLFNESVRIYAAPNAGRWYDFGFMLGISGFSGGLFAGARSTPRPTAES